MATIPAPQGTGLGEGGAATPQPPSCDSTRHPPSMRCFLADFPSSFVVNSVQSHQAEPRRLASTQGWREGAGPLGSVTPARGWQPGGEGVSQREKGVHIWVGQGHPQASSLPFKELTARISAIRGASCEKQPLFNNVNSQLSKSYETRRSRHKRSNLTDS